MTGPPSIRLRKLCKSFAAQTALTDIDLDLSNGQIVGIVGPDGAGKTTLLRTLAGLLQVQATEARVLGYDLRGDVLPLKAQVGYVPQDFSLPRELSIAEQLHLVARLHLIGRAEFESRKTVLLERTGLTPFVDRPAHALSGGMRQKLAVICALLAEPTLLLLDEPTAGVDVIARAEIWGLLRERASSTLILFSTSYLEEAELCERLIYLDSGRIVAFGTPQELCSSVWIELFRAWGDDPRAIALAARTLSYVREARAAGCYARVEVPRSQSPGAPRVLRDMEALPGAVRFVEQVPIDMEIALLNLAREPPR